MLLLPGRQLQSPTSISLLLGIMIFVSSSLDFAQCFIPPSSVSRTEGALASLFVAKNLSTRTISPCQHQHQHRQKTSTTHHLKTTVLAASMTMNAGSITGAEVLPVQPQVALVSLLSLEISAVAKAFMFAFVFGAIINRHNIVPFGTETHTDAKQYWTDVERNNFDRSILRGACKLIVSIMVTFGFGVIYDAPNVPLPSKFDQNIYLLFCTVDGIVDELCDMPKSFNLFSLIKKKQGSNLFRVSAIASLSLISLALLLPIPFLMGSNEIFIQMAVFQIVTNALSMKLDNVVSKFASFIGIAFIALSVVGKSFIAMRSWPLIGLGVLIICQILYQLHDEIPFLINLSKKVPEVIFHFVNCHCAIPLLVASKILPVHWLLLPNPLYSVTKLGLATGWHTRDRARSSSEQSPQTSAF